MDPQGLRPGDGTDAPAHSRPFKVESERRDGLMLVSVRGEIDMTTCPELTALLQSACERGERIVLDLAGCGFIDSTGIAMLVSVERRLENEDGRPGLTLCALQGQVRRLLDISGLTSHFAVFESPEEALASG